MPTAESAPPGAKRSSEPLAIRAALDRAVGAFPLASRFLIALSGGIDSVVLLHAAQACLGPDRCLAVHINHGLSAEADAWQMRCAEFADALGVSFVSHRVRVPRSTASSLEANAREARYAALAAVYREYDVTALLLGQHADDQAETVLLQLLRGAGLPGLAAMGGQAVDAYGMVRLRPLLTCTRTQIEAYAAAQGLCWVEDASNQDTRFARNALRHEVTPRLAEHFPGYRDALARAARHAADAQALLDDLARLDLQATRAPGVSKQDSPLSDPSEALSEVLSRAAFNQLSEPRAANLLRYWMRQLALPAAPAARLEAALRQLRSAREGTALRVDHAGYTLRAYRGLISWEPGAVIVADDELPAPSYLIWQGQPTWRLPDWRGTLVFAAAPAGTPGALPAAWLQGRALAVRAREGGERMRTGAAGRLRRLKNLFQEHGIPSWRRQLPLLFVGDNLLWVPGLGLNYDAFGAETHAETVAGPWLAIDWVPDLTIA